MTTIHFGVIDHPYAYTQGRGKNKKKINLSITTGDVAEILEDKYKLFETLAVHNEQFIADALAMSVERATETLIAGGQIIDPLAEACQLIQERMKEAIYKEELDNAIPGVPTVASGAHPEIREGGINHRLLHPYASSNPERPSFIDTGLFQASIKVWSE